MHKYRHSGAEEQNWRQRLVLLGESGKTVWRRWQRGIAWRRGWSGVVWEGRSISARAKSLSREPKLGMGRRVLKPHNKENWRWSSFHLLCYATEFPLPSGSHLPSMRVLPMKAFSNQYRTLVQNRKNTGLVLQVYSVASRWRLCANWDSLSWRLGQPSTEIPFVPSPEHSNLELMSKIVQGSLIYAP